MNKTQIVTILSQKITTDIHKMITLHYTTKEKSTK